MRTLKKSIPFVLLSFFILFIACEEKMEKPDAKRIKATSSIGTGGLVVSGLKEAVEPGATVTITDENGKIKTVTAEDDGSFFTPFPHSDSGVGKKLTVTQKTNDKNESKGVKVTITGP